MGSADYRKHNDRSKSSSTYHKKDGTAVRAILSREAAKEIREAGKYYKHLPDGLVSKVS